MNDDIDDLETDLHSDRSVGSYAHGWFKSSKSKAANRKGLANMAAKMRKGSVRPIVRAKASAKRRNKPVTLAKVNLGDDA
jgi:uncharacterized protein YidB (DUF937 family)